MGCYRPNPRHTAQSANPETPSRVGGSPGARLGTHGFDAAQGAGEPVMMALVKRVVAELLAHPPEFEYPTRTG